MLPVTTTALLRFLPLARLELEQTLVDLDLAQDPQTLAHLVAQMHLVRQALVPTQVQAVRLVLEAMPALAVMAMPVLVHLWVAVPQAMLGGLLDLVLVTREVCLLVSEVKDMVA